MVLLARSYTYSLLTTCNLLLMVLHQYLILILRGFMPYLVVRGKGGAMVLARPKEYKP
jgi:hypothetical protein